MKRKTTDTAIVKEAAYVKWYDGNKIDGVRRRCAINFPYYSNRCDNGKSRIAGGSVQLVWGYHQ